VVYFVDATYEKMDKGFELRPCIAFDEEQVSSHAQSPGAILRLANDLYQKFPEAWILAIGGESWEIQTSLSETAERNLVEATSFFAELFFETEVAETIFNG
jgi:hypothetical protein